MIDGQPRSATVHAETALTTISIPSWSFHPILDQEPEVSRALLRGALRAAAGGRGLILVPRHGLGNKGRRVYVLHQ